MMRPIIQSLAVIGLLATPIWSAAAMAQDGPSIPRNPPPRTRSSESEAPQTSPYLYVPGLWALRFEGVQKEIQLSDNQKQQLKALSDRYQATMQRAASQFHDLPREDQEKKMDELNSQFGPLTQKKAEAVLSPEQVQTVKKIDFQLFAAGALANPQAQQDIALSADQRARVAAIYEKSAERMQQVQRMTAEEALGVLTPAQRQKLQQQMESPGNDR